MVLGKVFGVRLCYIDYLYFSLWTSELWCVTLEPRTFRCSIMSCLGESPNEHRSEPHRLQEICRGDSYIVNI